MKRSPLNKESKSESALCKKRIQVALREIGLARQNGLCFFLGKQIGAKIHTVCTSGPTKDGHIVMQYDHLNPRERSVSYGDSRLGIVICQGLHGWKSFSDANKNLYDRAAKQYLPPNIVKLWERVEQDTKSYPMGIYEWGKIELGLKQELANLKGQINKSNVA